MAAQRENNEPFILITREEDFTRPSAASSAGKDPLSGPWAERGSAKFEDAIGFGARKLRELYPKHTVIPFTYGINLLSFPKAYMQPISPPEMIANAVFVPLARKMGQSAGVLVDNVRFGAFSVAWQNYDYILYVMQYLHGAFETTQHFLLHEGPEEVARALLHAAGLWTNDLHEEIYVFDSGYWSKDANLWTEVQKADWEDVILEDGFKKNLQKDVFGFFDSEELYKSLAIPWKRGIIMFGPPGNGKTISMKAIMKDADAKGYAPLYVKSFRSWKGEEGAMVDVFSHARRMAPCVVVLEDLDSLINPGNRSFFLNQLDGLESNDGLLVIGTTNHLENIDPALRDRPSRFDRKFLFDNPTRGDRILYVQYWQNKLKSNKSIEFPDSLVEEVADATTDFSFAFLKEVFVSTLVILAGYNDGDDKPTFKEELNKQITALKKQLDHSPKNEIRPGQPGAWVRNPAQLPQFSERGHLDLRAVNQPRIYSTDPGLGRAQHPLMPGELAAPGDGSSEQTTRDGRDMRSRALAAAALGRSFLF